MRLKSRGTPLMGLQIHFRITHISKRIKRQIDNLISCTKCPMKFILKRDLYKHLRTHGKVFECKICNKNYASCDDLKTHAKRVHYEKRLSCSICSKGFYFESILDRHMNMHKLKLSNQPMPYARSPKDFAASGKLFTHRFKHVDRIVCNCCSKEFKRKKCLTKHISECYKSQRQCDYCLTKVHNDIYDNHTYHCKKNPEKGGRKLMIVVRRYTPN